MNNNRPKLLLIIVCTVLLIGAAVWFNATYLCDTKEVKVFEQIESLGDSLAIKEIVLFQSHPGYEINLVSDTMTINNSEQLREFQRIIFDSKQRMKNHPITMWSVRIKIVFLNNDHLIMAVDKIGNDSINTMTHFSFPQNRCPGINTHYSLELGTYLEQLVSFQGKNHK